MTTVKVDSFSALMDMARTYLPAEKLSVLEGAYHFAAEAHEGQVRKSGGPYIEHPSQTALVLAELQLDVSSLAAALLHDVMENCGIPVTKIQSKFGPEIARLVDGSTKLGRVSWQAPKAREAQAENLRKMLVAMAEDLRVVFIKLADRLHNMRTLYALPPEQQLSIAQETLEIYAPLAHRLGIWEIKWQLEDLSFQYLELEKYNQIARLIDAKRAQREHFITGVIEIMKAEFQKAGLRAEISGRAKHIYSIHQKMERYAAQGKHFDDIYDLFALRILVSTVADCYSAVGIIHSLWRPIPEAFDDYIASTKPNGYQSLHTAVMYRGKTPLEVQIRSREMHYIDEYGVAAHWRYKQGEKADLEFEEKITWLRQLVDWRRDLSGAEEFLESVKTDIFIDQVFVYTPQGKIIDLPKGSTPIDLAYRIHTELGHRCVGAKVNGRLVSLHCQLHNGDVVEILATKENRGPSRDWLSPHLGFVKTSHARTKIRHWFTKQERTENIERGRQILEKELRRLGVKTDREELAGLFSYNSVDDFLAAVGYGGVPTQQIVMRLAAQHESPKEVEEVTIPKPVQSSVRVLGVGDLVTKIAQCCRPVPGDKIVGYVTRSQGVTIHREDCYNVLNEDEKERLVTAEWGQTYSVYPVTMEVQAWSRVGLIRDITAVVAEEKVSIAAMNFKKTNDLSIVAYLTFEVNGLAQLSRLMMKIEGIRGVLSASRIGDEATLKAR